MRNRFERQLLELNNELIQMGSMIEHAIEMGISALVRQDVEKAKKAIAYDEEIDEQEKTVESLCMKLLLQQQPVAKDLRLISAALKMITDMERIGDHAADISEMTILMSDATYERSAINIDLVESMAKEKAGMLYSGGNPASSISSMVSSIIQLSQDARLPLPIPSDSIITSLPSSYSLTEKLSPDTGEPYFLILLTWYIPLYAALSSYAAIL